MAIDKILAIIDTNMYHATVSCLTHKKGDIMDLILEIMHLAPMVGILVLLLLSVFKGADFDKKSMSYNAGLLIFSAVGISAGSLVHHHHDVSVFDPCFVYCAAIIYVAVRLMYSLKTRSIN